MRDYLVGFETRLPGAIGAFQKREVAVTAGGLAEAVDIAFEKLHRDGLETRFPLSVQQMSETGWTTVHIETVRAAKMRAMEQRAAM